MTAIMNTIKKIISIIIEKEQESKMLATMITPPVSSLARLLLGSAVVVHGGPLQIADTVFLLTNAPQIHRPMPFLYKHSPKTISSDGWSVATAQD